MKRGFIPPFIASNWASTWFVLSLAFVSLASASDDRELKRVLNLDHIRACEQALTGPPIPRLLVNKNATEASQSPGYYAEQKAAKRDSAPEPIYFGTTSRDPSSSDRDSSPHELLFIHTTEIASKAIAKFGLAEWLPDYKKQIAALYDNLTPTEWTHDQKFLASELERAANAADVLRIFDRLAHLTKKSAASLAPATTKQLKIPPVPKLTPGKIVMLGHVDRVEPSRITKKIGQKTVQGWHLPAGETVMLGRPVKMPEVNYFAVFGPEEIQQAAKRIYGHELKPLTETKEIPVEGKVSASTVAKALREVFDRYDLIPEPTDDELTFEELAVKALASKIVTYDRRGVEWRFTRHKSNPSAITCEKDVAGSMRRVYHHPTNPKKVVKVFDPSLKHHSFPESHFAKIMQYDLAMDGFLLEEAADLRRAGKMPYLEPNLSSQESLKLESGFIEADYSAGQTLGSRFELKTDDPQEPVPEVVERFFQGFRIYSPLWIQFGVQRFGPDFVFAHRLAPENTEAAKIERRHIIRFKLKTNDTLWILPHGIDFGGITKMENIHVIAGSDGREIAVKID